MSWCVTLQVHKWDVLVAKWLVHLNTELKMVGLTPPRESMIFVQAAPLCQLFLPLEL